MAREINRKRLTRLFELPDGAADAEIIEKIRQLTDRMNNCTRPFVLPTELDLRGCLYALWDCMRDDREFGDEAYGQLCDEIDRLRAANAERLRPINSRFTMLEIVIDRARDQTEWEDPAVLVAKRKEQALAKEEAAKEKRRQTKAAKIAKAAEEARPPAPSWAPPQVQLVASASSRRRAGRKAAPDHGQE